MKKSIQTDERGITHVLVAVLGVIVVAAVAFGAWRVLKKTNTPSTSGSNTASTVTSDAALSACQKLYNDTSFCKFASNFALTTVSYKATVASTDSSGTTSSSIEADGKGNDEITSTASGQAYDAIELSGATYVKDSTTGSWLKFSAGDSATPTVTNPTSGISFDTKSTTSTPTITYKKIDSEKCGSLTCLKYQVIDPSNPGTTEYLWFDTSDYLLREFSTKDSTSSSDMTFSYQPVTISAPSPVTDYSTSAASSLYSTPSTGGQ